MPDVRRKGGGAMTNYERQQLAVAWLRDFARANDATADGKHAAHVVLLVDRIQNMVDEVVSLRTQLAAAQAREGELRAALTAQGIENMGIGTTGRAAGWCIGRCPARKHTDECEQARVALARPADDSALREFGLKFIRAWCGDAQLQEVEARQAVDAVLRGSR